MKPSGGQAENGKELAVKGRKEKMESTGHTCGWKKIFFTVEYLDELEDELSPLDLEEQHKQADGKF